MDRRPTHGWFSLAIATARALRAVLPAAGLAAGLFAAGCGTPGAPQAPSLNLPAPVANLAATRTGNGVALTWTMPTKSTDKLLLKGTIAASVCRQQAAGSCNRIVELMLAPGAKADFADELPPSLTEGAPRALTYFIELRNRNNRSAGPSNTAVVVAGQAPLPVDGLKAEVRKAGVVLHWAIGPHDAPGTAIRLRRKLLTPQASKSDQGPLGAQPEPAEQSLLVGPETGGAGREQALDGALDKNIRFGETYEYRAQRVLRVPVNGKTLELDGPLSEPVRIEALDIFPPAVPTGLAAVANAVEAGQPPSIDLSWQPDTEADLAGYAVYRHEDGEAWRRISPIQPVVPPAFHDPQVEPGHIYYYSVTAIDQGGHQSARSAPAEETVPNP